jgi:uncharacterized protein with von Willebrand factor type A (vWA) domain
VKIFSYSKWDDSQLPFSLKKKDIIDRFMENIIKGMSPNMSLSQMLWEGFPLAGMDFRVMGLEEIIEELEKQKDGLFSKYSLEKIFDKPIDDLKNLLDDEAWERAESGYPESPSYDQLSPGLMEKLYDLEKFDFINEKSREKLDEWLERQQDILDLYEFYSEYADRFTGGQFLDFEQALELMRRFKAMDQLQRQLMTGQFSRIDPEKLREMLGDRARQSFNILLQLPQMIKDEGVAKFDRRGLAMTPRGMRALGETAFGKIMNHLKKDRQGRSLGNAPQSGEILPDSSRSYQYGDRLDIDIGKTILKSVLRGRGSSGEIVLDPDDFYVREREQLITTTTVVLLDLSWSMSQNGRFESAKKVALALDHYIRTRFPKDKIYTVGFSTEARELRGDELALAVWDSYQPFTNLQAGLQLAMHLIKRSGNRNNRVLIITDGQPTAYYIDGKLHVEFPDDTFGLSRNACKATLAEVRKVTAQGMNIETFMLDSNPVLVEFTHHIAHINKGRAVLCMPGKLGELVLVEEIKRRGGKI